MLLLLLLWCFFYERYFFSDNNQADVIGAFNSTLSCLVGLIYIDNPYFEQMVDQIYPTELHLKGTATLLKSVFYQKELYEP